MFSSPDRRTRARTLARARTRAGAMLIVGALACAVSALAQTTPKYPGIGRAATPKEVAAWDIDVRPDFKGLPPGKGTVLQGQDIWEAKCASCHGVFGESNQVFNPIVGGTTKEDVKTGRVARLADEAYPARTTLMKVATVSTLWDYIRRAMPWNEPKSLKDDEVYALTAFLLHLGEVVPENFELSERNIAQVQALMPNRNGMTTAHGLWPGRGFANDKPDVKATACMKGCVTEPAVASRLPDFARGAHGNLAEQNRAVGAQHGAVTVAAAVAAAPAAATAATRAEKATAPAAVDATALLTKHGCLACHGVEQKLVGPSFKAIAARHGAGAADMLAGKIKSGGSGVWGAIPMPPQTLPDADARALAAWIARGASK